MTGSLGLREILWAEWMAFYKDLTRRKSLIVSFIVYPYILTLLFVIMGLAVGGLTSFSQRFHVSAITFFLTMSYLMLTVLIGADMIMQRPSSDMWAGTLPYILTSPAPRILRYLAVALPMLAPFIVQGIICLTPVYVYYYGVEGAVLALLVVFLSVLAGLFMVPIAMVTMGLAYMVSEEGWRIINIARPLLLILIGVYYPRYLLPLVFRVATMVIPSSSIVEIIQYMLTNNLTMSLAGILLGVATASFILLLPIGGKTVTRWEERLRFKGVKEY